MARRLWEARLVAGGLTALSVLPAPAQAQAQARPAYSRTEPGRPEPESVTQAPPIGVTLQFAAPENCSDPQSFEAGLRARFPRIQVESAGSPLFRLEVRLSVHGDSVRGELRIEDASGESELRVVSGSDCSGVVAALSLTAALAIEQTTALTEPTTGAGASGETSTTPSSTDPGSSGKSPSAAPAKPPGVVDPKQAADESTGLGAPDPTAARYKVGLALWASPLVVPQTSFGVGLQGRFRWPGFGALKPEVGLAAQWVPVDLLQPRGNLAVSYRGIEGLVCPLQLRLTQGATLSPCAVATFGRLTASSRNVDLSTPSRRMQLAFGIDARTSFALGRGLLLELQAGLRVPTAHRDYVALEPAEQAGHTPYVGWILGLGALSAW